MTALSKTSPRLKDKFNSLDTLSNFAIVSTARKGLGTNVFYDFAEAFKMPEKNLAAILNLSSRTISN